MDTADFGEQYRLMQDEELLRINFDSDQLTDEARFALTAGLHTRSLDKPEVVADFRIEEQQRRKDDELTSVMRADARKIGRSRYFKANYDFNPETRIETFTTTFFFELWRLPLVPTGTYRVEKKKGWRYDYRVVEKVPLDWEQVLTGWVISASVVLALILAFKFVLPRFLFH